MGKLWDAFVLALVSLFSAATRAATVLDNLAKSAENASLSMEKHSRTLIPTDEQIAALIDTASGERDTSAIERANRLKEAQDKLNKARNDNK